MAELTRAERLAAARRKAQREARQKAEFGRDAGDKALGIISGLGFGAYGAGSDLMGGISSLLGFDEFGADQELRSDEAYQRASNYFKLGLGEGGRQGIKDSTFPLVSSSVFGPGTDEMRDAIIAQDNLKNQQAILEEENDSLFFDIDIPDKFSNESPITMGRDFELGALSRPTPKELSEQENLIGKGLPNTSNDFFEKEKKLQELKELSNNERLQMSGMPEINEEAVNDAFGAGMKDFNNAAGKKDITVKNETKADALERYKKEFTDATGIDASGKVDKSKALMAFGLALMQNKAGKGFNVGKMLQSVGSAGEAAQPMLNKAIDQARASKVAAGKYALDQIKAGESAASAIAAEEKAFQRERYLKILDMEADFEKERIKAGGKGTELKNVKVDKVINGLEVQRGRGPNGAAFVFPEDALRDSTGALRSVNGALETVDVMVNLATQISNEESPLISMLKESAQSALVGAGLADANVVFGEEGVGKRQKISILQDSIITQFKRMLTQETGNGISKVDVDNIKNMLGEIDLLGNPKESILRLNEIKTLFNGKRTAIRGVLDELQDSSMYPTESEYKKNMELLPSLLANNTQYSINKTKDGNLINVSDL